jgi:hypothetical protein
MQLIAGTWAKTSPDSPVEEPVCGDPDHLVENR